MKSGGGESGGGAEICRVCRSCVRSRLGWCSGDGVMVGDSGVGDVGSLRSTEEDGEYGEVREVGDWSE